jgi:hypothetical protein
MLGSDYCFDMGYERPREIIDALKLKPADRDTIYAGNAARVQMWWVNSGVAPVYSPYTLALGFDTDAGHTVIELPADVRKWLPGDALVDETAPIPRLPAGDYRLRVALLDPPTKKPAIQLGTEGRLATGWYDLGSIRLE